MCGIMGYVGKRPAVPIVLDGLRRLEYRGYDSAGLAVVNGKLEVVRAKGRIAELERKVRGLDLPGSCGLGHTRWATHGRPTEENAHPHRSCRGGDVAVIHNGIVENYAALKRELAAAGHIFASETDTEVLAHLVEDAYVDDLETAVRLALARVRGTFGAAFVHAREPEKIVAARRGSPLVLGLGKGEHFLASDVAPLVRHTREVIHLEDDEIAVLTPDAFAISSLASQRAVEHPVEVVEWDLEAVEKGGFDHFMLKEICEQPDSIRNAMRGRTMPEDGLARLGGLSQILPEILRRRRLVIVGCGTSYYAGLTARYLFEEWTDLEADVELASEFRYRKRNLGDAATVLAVSQSGETADTLGALREAKRQGALALGLVNVVGSSIARETDAGVYNHAGPEIGVASTKAFTSQLAILSLMAVFIGREQRLSRAEGRRIIEAMGALPKQLERVLGLREKIREVARRHARFERFFFIGRKYGYPVALEGALKMKEISYLHAEGYAAGELKHGPIALIDHDTCCVAIAPRGDLQEKMISNIEEVRARGATVIAVGTEGDDALRALASDMIEVPETIEELSPILEVVPLQLLAYYVATSRGCEVDRPRNLAKSVTVE